MIRSLRLLLISALALGVVLLASACGTEKAHLEAHDPTPKADSYAAQLFQQRCAGCHSLQYAGTYGSGQNPRTYLAISGPNFNVRCERPVERVLYAIENGGFSGAYMPQNIVVGQAARDVAYFVSRYAGRQAVTEPGQRTCAEQGIGTLPPLPTAYSYGQTETTAAAGPSRTKTATTPAITPKHAAVKPKKTKKK